MTEQDQWQQRIKQTLERQAVDDSTRNALRAARASALDGASRRPLPRWAQATAIAVLVLAVAGVVTFDQLRDPGFPEAEVDDIAVISSDDDFELYEELEFYLWFDEDENV